GWIAAAARDFRQSRRRIQTVGRRGIRTLAAVAGLYVVFLLMGGLNYIRVPLDRKLSYDGSAVTATSARHAAELAMARLNVLCAEAHARRFDDAGAIDPLLARAFEGATKQLGATATTVPARPKRPLLDVYFRPAGVSGMTDPFFLETLTESDLLP